MKEFKLNVAGLEPLREEEVKSVNGGVGPFAIALIAVALSTLITEFQDVREGFSDGYAGRSPRH